MEEDETADASKAGVGEVEIEGHHVNISGRFEDWELRSVSLRAETQAAATPNKTWKAAYMQLALAADHLSLMLGRTTETARE